ncbi:MAG: histidinol dehydrogenase [Rhodospirillales bacterium]|nr:histidinol dehydrogenase [Rhodospirillales bacterium]
MSINFYRWNETDDATKARIMRRSQADIDDMIAIVAPIIEDVKTRGDAALIDYAKKFDKAEITNLKATPEEYAAAENALDEDLKAAIAHGVRNVKKFHEEQMRRAERDKSWMIEIEPGVFAGEQINPIESVGLYVPRGKGAFPSALYMLAIPAVIADVKNIAVVSPPTPEGATDAATLYTAKLCGIENVYKCGGAQAIAALAYGTQTVPQVKKVLGPGSPYVAAAKRVCSVIMDPGMPAGPSESIVLADETADPENTCLDILNEGEHGEDSAALLVTHDEKLAKFVQQNLPSKISELPEPHKTICTKVMGDGGYGGIILTENLSQSIAIANAYAPEHLLLKTADPESVLPKLTHAGEILIGEYTAFSLGNYATGVNHVLPTGGWAHTYSCTSVWDFLKRTSLSRCTKDGFNAIKDSVTTLTDYEGFPAHGDALRKRKL